MAERISDVYDAYEVYGEAEHTRIIDKIRTDNSQASECLLYARSEAYPRPSLGVVANLLANVFTIPSAQKLLQEFALPLAGFKPPQGVDDLTVLAGKGMYEVEDRIGGCELAEGYFYDALSQIRTLRSFEQKRISVYRDPEGVPLILRKTHQLSSGLTLQPLVVEGAGWLPAGVIVDMETTGFKSTAHRNFARTNTTLGVYDQMPVVAPRRISAWAYEQPYDIGQFAVGSDLDGEPLVDEARLQRLQSRTLGDFQQAAERIIQLCDAA